MMRIKASVSRRNPLKIRASLGQEMNAKGHIFDEVAIP